MRPRRLAVGLAGLLVADVARQVGDAVDRAGAPRNEAVEVGEAPGGPAITGTVRRRVRVADDGRSGRGAGSGPVMPAGAGAGVCWRRVALLDDLRDRLRAPWQPVSTAHAAAAGAALLALAWAVAGSDGYVRILDDANLAFHEAGHPLFGVFGATPALYGGTLGQLAFPTVVLLTSLVRRQPLAVAAGAAWFGQNLVNIARYCADARAQELPLVGGGEHDWLHILTRWGALHRDLEVAAAIRTAGWALIAIAAGVVAWRWRADRRDGVEG